MKWIKAIFNNEPDGPVHVPSVFDVKDVPREAQQGAPVMDIDYYRKISLNESTKKHAEIERQLAEQAKIREDRASYLHKYVSDVIIPRVMRAIEADAKQGQYTSLFTCDGYADGILFGCEFNTWRSDVTNEFLFDVESSVVIPDPEDFDNWMRRDVNNKTISLTGEAKKLGINQNDQELIIGIIRDILESHGFKVQYDHSISGQPGLGFFCVSWVVWKDEK